MSSTNFTLQETASFSAKLIHHEEIKNYLPENITNFANPLISNKEVVNDNFIFK